MNFLQMKWNLYAHIHIDESSDYWKVSGKKSSQTNVKFIIWERDQVTTNNYPRVILEDVASIFSYWTSFIMSHQYPPSLFDSYLSDIPAALKLRMWTQYLGILPTPNIAERTKEQSRVSAFI